MTTPIRQGPEAACAAIVATLRANLNTDVDNVWTAWSGSGADPTDETAPPKVYVQHYYKFGRALIGASDYPAVVVSPAPGSRQISSFITTPNNPSAAWDLEQHRLFVEVGVLGGDKYELEAVCTRLVWALRTCLLKHPELDGDPTTLLGGYGGSLTIGTFGVGQASEYRSAGHMLQIWGGVEVFLDVAEVIA